MSFNFEAASNTKLVEIIRSLQEDSGNVINAFSTLMRMKRTDMVAKIQGMLDGFDITDAGDVVKQANGQDEPAPLVIPMVDVGGFVVLPEDAEAVAQALTEMGTAIVEPATEELVAAIAVEQDALPIAVIDAVKQAIDEIADVVPLTPVAKPGRTPKLEDTAIITVVKANPKRSGTAAWRRYNCLKVGDTVAQYLAKVVAIKEDPRAARGTLGKAVRRGDASVG